MIQRAEGMTRKRHRKISQQADLDCLRAIRRELRSTYPRVRVRVIFRIMHEHGLKHLPEGLLLKAGSRLEAYSMLFWAAHPRKAPRIDWHPLFSSAYYLAVNPDVATVGASAWLHYQVYGRPEGRSPHPLLDTDFLAASMPGVRREDVIDEYVTCPARWVLDTSPYVDCLRFMLEGEWDGYTNPLQQIVSHYLGGPWIHHRLLLIDAASDSQASARLRGACALLTSNAPGSRFVEVKFWALAQGKEFLASTEHETLCTVIPGYFLGANDREIISHASHVSSPDHTMIRLPTEFVSLATGEKVSATVLHYLAAPLTHEELVAAVRGFKERTAISPCSAGQEISLRQLCERLGASHITVLGYGRQVRVECRYIKVTHRMPIEPPIAEWSLADRVDPKSIVVVLSLTNRRRATNDQNLRELLVAGASLCLIGSEGIDSWIPVLQSRARVLVDRAVLDHVRGVIPEKALNLLPGGEAWKQ